VTALSEDKKIKLRMSKMIQAQPSRSSRWSDRLCKKARKWILTQPTARDAWEACQEPLWLIGILDCRGMPISERGWRLLGVSLATLALPAIVDPSDRESCESLLKLAREYAVSRMSDGEFRVWVDSNPFLQSWNSGPPIAEPKENDHAIWAVARAMEFNCSDAWDVEPISKAVQQALPEAGQCSVIRQAVPWDKVVETLTEVFEAVEYQERDLAKRQKRLK